jgi:hypothetical protein
MERLRTHLLVLLAGLALMAAASPTVALAASSPTVSSGAVTKIADSSAVLNGVVNPNGSATQYVFSYGPTTAYGANTAPVAVGSGTKAVDVTRTISGLTPGTLYHYRLAAINRSGTTFGTDRTFTTSGHPPAAVVTGPPSSVTQTTATPTGTINPEGAATSWVIQYGLTANYGYETFPQQLAAGASPVAVAAQLVGLAPATLFHYRILATHASGPASVGADATFFTEPAIRPLPRIAARTTPALGRRAPFDFTTHGTLRGGEYIPAAQRCTGNVGVRVYSGRRQLAFVVVPVAGDCTFVASDTFGRLHGLVPQALAVKITFRGNGYLAPATRTNRVTAG